MSTAAVAKRRVFGCRVGRKGIVGWVRIALSGCVCSFLDGYKILHFKAVIPDSLQGEREASPTLSEGEGGLLRLEIRELRLKKRGS